MARGLSTLYRFNATALSVHMREAVIGIIGNHYLLHDRFDIQMTGMSNINAVDKVCNALPLMFAGNPAVTHMAALFDTVDGILLTGAR